MKFSLVQLMQKKFFVEQCNNGNRAMQNSNAIFKIEQFILMD